MHHRQYCGQTYSVEVAAASVSCGACWRWHVVALFVYAWICPPRMIAFIVGLSSTFLFFASSCFF
jgi:hypothetical protein